MDQIFVNLSIQGVGFAFCYLMLKQTFKTQDVTMSKFDTLCAKIEELVKILTMHNSTINIQYVDNEKKIDNINVNLEKISNKIDMIHDDLICYATSVKTIQTTKHIDFPKK